MMRIRPALLATLLFALTASCGKGDEDGAPGPGPAAGGMGAGAGAGEEGQGKSAIAVLETTQGRIHIRLFPAKAPEHVRNFIEHCQSGYYRGTYFHRVFPGFMIQGGDPNTRDGDKSNDGQGGYSWKGAGTYLKAEFNDVKHRRGIVSMARSDHPDSAGSQFFIMVADSPDLDRHYSAFGEVVSGMKAVDAIVSQPGDPIPGSGGANPYEKQLIMDARIEMMAEADIAALGGE